MQIIIDYFTIFEKKQQETKHFIFIDKIQKYNL